MANLEKGNKKLGTAWAFYDWANSVYNLVISSAIFPIYYGALFKIKGITSVQFLGFEVKNTALISFVTAFAFLIVAIMSPLLSGIADFAGNKKRFMQFFCYLGALSCIGLSFFTLDNLYFGILCFFFGLIGFWGSLVFYNSYLPDIAFPEQQDKLSAKGYSLGYIGSVILLLFNLAMVMKPDFFGIMGEDAAMKAMQYSFISVGIWWIVFSQYTFYYLPKNAVNNKVTKNVIFNGYKELKKVWHQLEENIILKKYLRSFFVYSMAVQTVMLVATYFGEQEIAWETDSQRTTGLIISILVIQIVAVFGAIITSRVSEKIGNIKALIIINSIWIVICIYAYFVVSPVQFYITAGFVGLVMGGIQSLSRSTYSKLLPDTKDTTSFFSFYDVAEKIGIVIGMGIFATIDQISGSMRNAIVFLAVFFIIGVFLLTKVQKIVVKK
ncbi:MFS transporter [uncultured Flavobacterium sp.]|uniref:MFS transporter n=1 Tax=uncultured Flavobacterium sp. TaxID=165435 RepID=UPI0030ECD6D3|tara:strand:+ start:27675 stop:28991 length:1317 start_codon:yes stop_codon:yes gene_type:complete